MNFVQVTTGREGDRAVLHDEAFTVPLPDRFREAVGPTTGRSLTLGFRPEHLAIGPVGDNAATVRTNVDVVEFLGNEELLHLRAGHHDLVAVVDARPAPPARGPPRPRGRRRRAPPGPAGRRP